jgi:hypothetical protein
MQLPCQGMRLSKLQISGQDAQAGSRLCARTNWRRGAQPPSRGL